MRLDRLLGQVDVLETRGDPADVDVRAITFNTADVVPGALYCCLPGARFDGHPWTQQFTADVVEPSHPACAHLGTEWRWRDEVYQFRDLRTDARVLLRVPDSELDLTVSGSHRPDFGFPLSWCFTEGSGRVFSTTLGHFPAACESVDYLRHLAGGLAWALGESD